MIVPAYQATLTSAESVSVGSGLALSGDTLIAGSSPLSGSGKPTVFVRSGDTWTEQATLWGDDTVDKDDFGFAVSVSGDTAVVGALEANGTRGAAYVFVRAGTTWTQQAKLTVPEAAVGDRVGWSVAISGDTILLGAPRRSMIRGAVYVFVRSGATWSEQATLTADDAAVNSFFGINVALNGDDAVVGASFANGREGEAYVFHRSGATWTQQGTLLPSDPKPNAMFGYPVSVHGERVVVGASGYDLGSPGAAYVFARSSGTWKQEAKLESAGAVRFGWSAAIHDDIVVVGATESDNIGRGYVFAPIAGTWTEQAKLTPMDGVTNDAFGTTAVIGKDVFAFGVPNHAMNKGAVYVYGYTGKADFDAGVDAAPDSAPPDATPSDATADAPTETPAPTSSSSGCGCTTARRDNAGALASLIVAALTTARGRRRSRRCR